MIEVTPSNEELLRRLSEGDPSARELLICKNTPLVHSVVRRFLGRGTDGEDLFQIGCIGLIKAVHRFDTSFEVKFSTYAVPMIMGEIKRFLRDDGIIKVSRSMKELAVKAMRLREELTAKTGTEPGICELAEQLRVSPAELACAFDAGATPESLYAPSGSEDSPLLIDRLESGKDYAAEVTDRVALSQILEELPPREQTIIIQRYFKQKTQAQVAELLGVSQVQVSRIEKKLLIKIRKKMLDEVSS